MVIEVKVVIFTEIAKFHSSLVGNLVIFWLNHVFFFLKTVNLVLCTHKLYFIAPFLRKNTDVYCFGHAVPSRHFWTLVEGSYRLKRVQLLKTLVIGSVSDHPVHFHSFWVLL